MSLSSQKAGIKFQKPSNIKTHGSLSPEEWAALMLLSGFPTDPKVIAEGLGTIEAESGFNPNPGGDGAHFGAWQEDSSFGSEADRLDPIKSTAAAQKRWSADGKSFYNAWTRWQIEQSGVNGAANGVKKYSSIARRVIEEYEKSGVSSFGKGNPLTDAAHAAGDIVGGIASAEDFLVELAKTVLDYKKLGQLAAEATSWFTRLLAKALWDYVIAPLIHWSERAVSFYWTNFFSTGTEQGSGIGYQLRQNAGIITIVFWSLGYAVLWTDGTSLSPADAQSSLLGQGVKKIDGAIARRHLVKPQDVEEKTPNKPEPKTSTVTIERTQSFSVSRNRPVKVASSGGEHSTGRKKDGSRTGQRGSRIARPGEGQEQNPNQKIIVPPGQARPAKAKAKAQEPAQSSGPRESPLRDSQDRTKDAPVTS